MNLEYAQNVYRLPLERAGKQIVESDLGSEQIEAILSRDVPWLLEQIANDRAERTFDAWALSSVIDEQTNAPIISRPLFVALHEWAGIDAHWPIGNAGLLHTYGYLLSNEETPYGLKRERWLTPTLAHALGRDGQSFLPISEHGTTLLRRVTDAGLPVLTEPPGDLFVFGVDDEVPGGDGEVPDGGSGMSQRILILRDDSVPFMSSALIVGMVARSGDDGVVGTGRLVTLFPVAGRAERLIETLREEPPRLRFNAAAPGLPALAPLGRRVPLPRESSV